ncbi:SAV_2336 N-terminal domain-related protein [Streptomyces lunaelactis]|uniref:SAV_2336 N-terminal domain-related protein n=1 Tax=Streptomyces lunaelactis TaxID=1535768 RepID=UPI0015855060|nr:SAV_2336 N-terminal domain-related protein [Streptomyces lunaelactis]NUK69429.1 pentapeptide repeat-containing protein [Streptomyces lunaelactis]
MIEELLAAFSDGGVDAGPEEIADILWLAARVDAASGRRPLLEGEAPDRSTQEGVPQQDLPGGSAPAARRELLFPAAVRDPADEVSGPGEEDGVRRGVPLRVPRAEALREPLAVMRSLRPIGRRSIGGPGEELDEQLTVERSIEHRMLSPVLRPAESRWLDLALVVDTHHSMVLWADLVEDLRRALTRSGVFRDVRTWFLTGTESGGSPMVAYRRGSAPRHPQELADPSGRRLILVCTDTVGGGWREPGVQEVLRQWRGHNAVAVLTALPARLWSRGAVQPVPYTIRADRPAAAGRSWQQLAVARRSHRRRAGRATISTPAVVPVVGASPDSLSRLAGLVSGDGRRRNMACIRLDALASPDAAADAGPRPAHGLDAVERFRAGASPTAQQLAAHLAAVPLTLPVMTLVRRSLLRDSNHGHLAEVALGGLLEPWSALPADTDPDDLRFDFLPGVREALLGSQLRGDVAAVRELVRRSVWNYIAHSRSAVREFSATRLTGGSEGTRRVGDGQEPFAEGTAPAPEARDRQGAPGDGGAPNPDRSGLAARIVTVRTGRDENDGVGLLLTPRLVLTSAHTLSVVSRRHFVRGYGREVACTVLWRGRLGAALLSAEENIVDGFEWRRLMPERLSWVRPPVVSPLPVSIHGLARSGDQVEMFGRIRPGGNAAVDVEITAPFSVAGWPGLLGATVAHEGAVVGVISRLSAVGSRPVLASSEELLRDDGFRRALDTHMERPYLLDHLADASGPEESEEAVPAVCLAVEVKAGGWNRDGDVAPVPRVSEREVAERLVAVMREQGVDGVVEEPRQHRRVLDLLVRLDGPEAVLDLGRLLGRLHEAASPQIGVMVGIAASFGEVTESFDGDAVADAVGLVADPFFRAQMRQAVRFAGQPLFLAVTGALRERIAETAGPGWERRLVPLGSRGEVETGHGWLYEGDLTQLGRAITSATGDEGGRIGPGLSWVCCGAGATEEDPVGCTGIVLPGYEACLAHLSDTDRAAHLATLSPGDSVDYSGTTFTRALLDEVMAALWDAVDGQVRLGNAVFNEAVFDGTSVMTRARFGRSSFRGAVFHGRSWFDEAVFSADAVFDHATFHRNATFAKATFEGAVSFHHATFHDVVDMSSLGVAWTIAYDYATFHTHVTFESAALQETASFDYTTFGGTAVFAEAAFQAASFDYATFRRRPSLNRAAFHGGVSFDYATFGDGLEAVDVVFWNPVSFDYGTFDGPVLLAGVEFRGSVSFDSAAFHHAVACRDTTFHGSATFHAVVFNQGAQFVNVRFAEGAQIPGVVVGTETAEFHLAPRASPEPEA